MDVLSEAASFVKTAAEKWLKQKRPTAFARLHPAVQRQCLRLQLAAFGVTPTYDLVETLRQTPNQFVTVNPHSSFARDTAGRIQHRDLHKPKFDAREVSVKLAGPQGRCRFGEVEITWQTQTVTGRFRRPKPMTGRELFDADKLGASIRLRHWRAGDRFQPIGMSAAVKLQDLFTNLKIPRDRRRRLLVATTRQGAIFWVEGLRIGEKFKLDETTRRRVEWQWQREEF